MVGLPEGPEIQENEPHVESNGGPGCRPVAQRTPQEDEAAGESQGDEREE